MLQVPSHSAVHGWGLGQEAEEEKETEEALGGQDVRRATSSYSSAHS